MSFLNFDNLPASVIVPASLIKSFRPATKEDPTLTKLLSQLDAIAPVETKPQAPDI